MSKKKKEETVEVEPVSEPKEAVPVRKVAEPSKRTEKLDTFVRDNNRLSGTTLGAAFRRWCELEDKANVSVRKDEEDWMALFEQFIKREVH